MSTPRDPTDLLGQDADAEAEQSKAEATALQQAGDIKWLMANEAGRRIAWRMFDKTGVYRNPFTGTDAQTNFNCGEMNVGQWFLAQVIEHCPEAHLLMLTERTKP